MKFIYIAKQGLRYQRHVKYKYSALKSNRAILIAFCSIKIKSHQLYSFQRERERHCHHEELFTLEKSNINKAKTGKPKPYVRLMQVNLQKQSVTRGWRNQSNRRRRLADLENLGLGSLLLSLEEPDPFSESSSGLLELRSLEER